MSRILNITLCFLVLQASVCIAQTNDDTMEKFDIKSFRKKSPKGLSMQTTLPNGDIVLIYATGDHYVKTTTTNVDPYYVYYIEYDKKGNPIKNITTCYRNIGVGIRTYYDSKGNVIETFDFDSEFPFSLNDFLKKIKEEFNYDVTKFNTNKDYDVIERDIITQYGLNKPVYTLKYTDYDDPSKMHCILVDGDTGETVIHVFDTIIYYPFPPPDENQVDPYQEYIENLRKINNRSKKTEGI